MDITTQGRVEATSCSCQAAAGEVISCQAKVPPIRAASAPNVQVAPSAFLEMLKSVLPIRLCCSADITKAPSEIQSVGLIDSRCSSLEEGEIREDPTLAKDSARPLPTTPSTAPPTGTVRSKSSSSLGSNDAIENLPDHKRTEAEIHATVRRFVKVMIRGVESSVLSIDGQLKSCTCSLDRKLRFFVVEVARRVRKIPLTSIKEVQQGLEPEDIETPLDHLCATLILATDECITFRFTNVPERQDFALCLSVLLDGQ